MYPRRPRRVALWGGPFTTRIVKPVRTPRAEGGAGTARAGPKVHISPKTRDPSRHNTKWTFLYPLLFMVEDSFGRENARVERGPGCRSKSFFAA